jgi:hypothetical protein
MRERISISRQQESERARRDPRWNDSAKSRPKSSNVAVPRQAVFHNLDSDMLSLTIAVRPDEKEIMATRKSFKIGDYGLHGLITRYFSCGLVQADAVET